MHNAIKSLEHHTIEKLKGNDEHFLFSTMSFEQMQLLYAWVRLHCDMPSKSIIIDAEKAPFWLLNLAAGRKIDAIKEIRERLKAYDPGNDEDKSIKPALVNAKNFVEAILEALVLDKPSAEITEFPS
jgi:hypothetical protein